MGLCHLTPAVPGRSTSYPIILLTLLLTTLSQTSPNTFLVETLGAQSKGGKLDTFKNIIHNKDYHNFALKTLNVDPGSAIGQQSMKLLNKFRKNKPGQKFNSASAEKQRDRPSSNPSPPPPPPQQTSATQQDSEGQMNEDDYPQSLEQTQAEIDPQSIQMADPLDQNLERTENEVRPTLLRDNDGGVINQRRPRKRRFRSQTPRPSRARERKTKVKARFTNPYFDASSGKPMSRRSEEPSSQPIASSNQGQIIVQPPGRAATTLDSKSAPLSSGIQVRDLLSGRSGSDKGSSKRVNVETIVANGQKNRNTYASVAEQQNKNANKSLPGQPNNSSDTSLAQQQTKNNNGSVGKEQIISTNSSAPGQQNRNTSSKVAEQKQIDNNTSVTEHQTMDYEQAKLHRQIQNKTLHEKRTKLPVTTHVGAGSIQDPERQDFKLSDLYNREKQNEESYVTGNDYNDLGGDYEDQNVTGNDFNDFGDDYEGQNVTGNDYRSRWRRRRGGRWRGIDESAETYELKSFERFSKALTLLEPNKRNHIF